MRTMAWLVCLALLGANRQAAAEDLHGAVVAAGSEAAAPSAKRFGRLVYREPLLRPTTSEAVVRVLAGEPAATDAEPAVRDLAAALAAANATPDPAVAPRLFASIGRQVGAELVVVVDATAVGPTARVLRVTEQRFLAVALAPATGAGPDGEDWSDAVAILRGLAQGQAAPGPREPTGAATTATPRTAPAAAPGTKAPGSTAAPAPTAGTQASDETGPGTSFWKSPWFWGGLGVVVATGVTVLVLSQTALKEPDTVMLEGRIGR